MRLKNSLKNIKYNLFFFAISIFLVFITRRIFIQEFGYEITGLHELFKNIIGFLNIAELGIYNAISFSLYKPLKDRNYQYINSILMVYKYLYRFVAIFIFFGALTISFFIEYFIKDTTININLIRGYFILFSFIPISSYLMSYRQVIAFADQKNFIIIRNQGILNILKTVCQIGIIYISKNYFSWILVELIFNLITYIILNIKLLNEYKWIKSAAPSGNFKSLIKENHEVFINVKNLFFHKIGTFVIWQTDNILISSFTSLKNVAIYSSYILVTNAIKQLFDQFNSSVRASIGNLIAEQDDERSFTLWKEIYTVILAASLIVSFCFYMLIDEVINLWIGKEFLIDRFTTLLLTINLFFALTRQITDAFKDGYGIFQDKWAPLAEALTNFVISIILVQKLGIAGVVIGTNISNFLIIFLWKPYILFREGFKRSILVYFKVTIKAYTLGIVSILPSAKIYLVLSKYFLKATLYGLLAKSLLLFFCTLFLTLALFALDESFRKIMCKYYNYFKRDVVTPS